MKTQIEKYLESENVISSFNYNKKEIAYKKIKQGREIKKISGDEELVRAYLLEKLVKELGYLPENIEIEKEYDIGRPKVNKPRIDIILKDKNDNAFLFIEVKKYEAFEKEKEEAIEKQLFNLAGCEKALGKEVKYLVYYSCDFQKDKIHESCVIIDYTKYSSFAEWKEERNYADELPAMYGKAQKEPFIKNGKKDLDTNFSHSQIDALRKNLHDILWGGGGTDDNEVFSSLVNIILAKIQDESDKKRGEKYEFQNFAFETKEQEEFETKETLFARINGLYRKALKERLNITDEARLSKSFVIHEEKFSLSKLKYAVSELERFSFVEGKNSFSGKDILGDFFEGIIRDGFKQSKGQFFTHTNIVCFLLWAMKLDEMAINSINKEQKIPYFIDPSSGSGTFLIEYMKFITENAKRRFKNNIDSTRDIDDKMQGWFYPENRENKWAERFIYGVEHNFNLGTSVKVNMILHGDGSSNIFVKDGLLPFEKYKKASEPNVLSKYNVDKSYKEKDVNGEFDVIITNPPFSVSLDKDTKEMLGKSFLFHEKKNSENLFIERYYQLLRENGRLGVVLPESIFDTTENKYIRLFIFKYFKVKAVVSLPQETFAPYTQTKTSLLFAQKKMAKEMAEWERVWSNASSKYNLLQTRAEKELEFLETGKMNNRWAIAGETEELRKENILTLLSNVIEEDEKDLPLNEIIAKYKEEIKELCKVDKDTTDVFGFVNTAWVFGEVSRQMNYQIFMAEAENIGYKRTKRGEKPQKNDLFREIKDENGRRKVLLSEEDGIYETILDEMRKINWD